MLFESFAELSQAYSLQNLEGVKTVSYILICLFFLNFILIFFI